jgi:betaine lipid synthase
MSPSLLTAQDKRFAWIDIGGGTGENIERMNQFFPVKNFERVYVVDITPSLCRVAEERFKRLGWTNVTVLCMDASKFEIPSSDFPDTMEIALITLSYSLSMMESFYPLVDRLSEILSPAGILGVADFYVSNKRSSEPTRQLGWLMRWFWSVWFDLDNIYLHPARRDYLEHTFKTVKSLNCKNHFIKPFVKIPYYVWIGAQKNGVLSDFVLDAPSTVNKEEDDSVSVTSEPHPETPDVDLGSVEQAVYGQTVVSPAHIHGQGVKWRRPFDVNLIPRFNTYIYAFTWEDPQVDLQFLELTKDDSMMVITSGGCNVLEYAVQVGPKRIHCVDLNPCQNHLLELKMAGIKSFQYADFWRLFGEGSIPHFSTLLDTHFSPYLSPYAYHYWKQSANFKSLFKTGCSGLAIRVFSFVVKMKGLKDSVERMCHADTLEEQWAVWETEIRPHFLSTWLIRILNNERFLWGALGVPPAQMQMLLQEGVSCSVRYYEML